MIYLDNNATTLVDPYVIEAMRPFFEWGANPSSIHALGRQMDQKIQAARRTVAQVLQCSEKEILFTSSGTESNNLCLKGYAFANREKGNHLITSKIEHPSVLETFAFLKTKGFEVTYLDVDEEGFVDPDMLARHLRKETLLISIGHVNHEIGVIQPLEALLDVAKNIPFHTDAVQSFLKTDFNIQKYPVALASFSGHKFHAPKGIGFIYKKNGITLEPQMHGGHQESGLRAGTENVVSIIGMQAAIDHFIKDGIESMKEQQSYLITELEKRFQVKINGPKDLTKRVCSNINVSFGIMEGEDILRLLSQKSVYISTGSACTSKKSRISAVLKAIGCPPRYIHGNIRIGLSKYTQREEIETFLEEVTRLTKHRFCTLSAC